MSFTNHQIAFEYALYMIASSYFMDKLAQKLPARFFDQEMEVCLIRKGDGEFTEVLLKNAQYVIRFLCKYAGKKSQICHEVWSRQEYAVRKDRIIGKETSGSGRNSQPDIGSIWNAI